MKSEGPVYEWQNLTREDALVLGSIYDTFIYIYILQYTI